MNKIFIKLFIIVLIVVLLVAFASSYRALNIDNLAFAVALGIDTSETKGLKITFQFVNPPSTSEGSNQEANIFEDTVEATSIPNAINIMNSYLARKIDLSHCRSIVFSEDVAKNGISDHVYTLMNDVQVRPTSNIITTTCTAYEYLKNSIPSLETSITRYYDIFPSSGKYTGYVSDATIGNFYNSLLCNTCDPHTILGGVSSTSSTDSQSTVSTNSNIKSGSSPISGMRSAESIGIVAFKHDKLVGELNAIETICFHILKNNINSFIITVPSPKDKTLKIDLLVTPKGTCKTKVDIVNGSPYVKINGSFNAKIYSMDENENYLDCNFLDSLSNTCNLYLENVLLNYLYKTSLEFKSDINGIGKYALSNFSTTSNFKAFNWSNNYMNSTFNVTINTTIDSGFLLNKT